LPDVGKHRGAVELLALEANIGVTFSGLGSRIARAFSSSSWIPIAARRSRAGGCGGSLSRLLLGLLAVEPGAELALLAVERVLGLLDLDSVTVRRAQRAVPARARLEAASRAMHWRWFMIRSSRIP
jgi:hypothetical protein